MPLDLNSLSGRQALALAELYPQDRPKTVLLYGGAGFSGKSHLERFALIHHHIYCVEHYGIEQPRTFHACNILGDVLSRHKTGYETQYREYGRVVMAGQIPGFHFHNQRYGVIEFRHLEQPDRFRGNEYLAGAVDESTEIVKQVKGSEISTLNALNYAIRSNLTNPPPMWLLLGANPDGPGFLWHRKTFIDQIDTQGIDPDWIKFIPARWSDHPNKEAAELARKSLEAIENPVVRAARLEGSWDIPSGMRFRFDPKIHVVRGADRWPKGLPEGMHVIGYDWGYGVPFCALWMVVQPGGDIHIYNCVYRSQLTVADQVRAMRDATPVGVRIAAMYCDEAIKQRQMTSITGRIPRSTYDELKDELAVDERFPMPHLAGNRDRAGGFNVIDGYLQPGNNRPSITIDPRCKALIDEIEGAVIDPKDPHSGDIADSCADHALTALYFVLRSLAKPLSLGRMEDESALYKPMHEVYTDEWMVKKRLEALTKRRL